MKDPVLAQLAALKGATANALKVKWRALFDTEPPPYNRRFLESRLAYRIQELAYGGVKKEKGERRRGVGRQKNGQHGGDTQSPARIVCRSPGRDWSANGRVCSIASPFAETTSNSRADLTNRCRPSRVRSP